MKNMIYILPILLYYLIESLLIGGIIWLGWILMFQQKFNFTLSYFNVVFIVWTFKMIFFDIFKISTFFINAFKTDNNKEENEK
jgi:hypothetical protein